MTPKEALLENIRNLADNPANSLSKHTKFIELYRDVRKCAYTPDEQRAMTARFNEIIKMK